MAKEGPRAAKEGPGVVVGGLGGRLKDGGAKFSRGSPYADGTY
jgi:hypothetical protein